MLKFYNPDEFIRTMSGWNQEYNVLSNKGFEAQAQQLEVGGVVFTRAKIKGHLLQRGSVVAGHVAFGIPRAGSDDISFRGRPISQTSMKCLKTGMETSLVSPSLVDLFVINAPRASLENYLGGEVCDDFQFLNQNVLQKKFEALSSVMDDLTSDNPERMDCNAIFDALLDETNPSNLPDFESASIRNFDKRHQMLMEVFDSSVGVVEASEYIGMSPYLLNSYCKKLYGSNYTRSGTIFRLNKARKFLYFYNGKQSISDICYECGFNSTSHFSKEFKKLFCISPRDYISQVR